MALCETMYLDISENARYESGRRFALGEARALLGGFSDARDQIGALKRMLDELPPVLLLAGPELEVFHDYRCYDDIEEPELHGSFLLDGQGRVRWQDIRFEPFTDQESLLTEAQLLLGPPAPVQAVPGSSSASSAGSR